MAAQNPTPPPRSLQAKPRRVHLVLRDGAEVEGGIFLNDGQALAPYLGSRKGGWVNLVAAQWILPVVEDVNHAVLQADHILYAYGTDGDVPVHGVTGAMAVRDVEVTLSTDARIRGQLCIADRQRLSDFLHTVGKFIPIVGVRIADTNALVGDIALNHAAVRVLRDTAPAGRATAMLDGRTPPIGSTAVSADARMTPPIGSAPVSGPSRGTPAAGFRVTDHEKGAPPRRATASMPLKSASNADELSSRPTPAIAPAIAAEAAAPSDGVRTEQISVGGGNYTLEMPGPNHERRSGSRSAVRARITLTLEGDNPIEVQQEQVDESPQPFSPAVAAVGERAAKHWLALVAQRFGLNPPDPRKLDASFGLEQLWDAIARANEITGDEFAVHVASTFRLPVARLDRIEASAIQLLKEGVAREFGIIPVRSDDKGLTVACADPTDLAMEQALRLASLQKVQYELAPPRAIRGALDWWYRGEQRPSTAVQAIP